MTKAFAKKEGIAEKDLDTKEKTCCCTKKIQTEAKSCCKDKNQHTEIIAEYDVGFGNTMFIRGCCCKNLNWDKGVAMENISGNLWKWTTDCKCKSIEFKLLINDEKWSEGENMVADCCKINHVVVKF